MSEHSRISTVIALRMVLTSVAFETAIAPGMTGRLRPGLGRFAWRQCGRERELLITNVEPVDGWPNARQWEPLADVALIAVVDDLSAESLAELAARIAPAKSQTLAVLLIDRTRPERWLAAIHIGTEWKLIDEVVITGPRLLRLQRHVEHAPQSSTEDRWSRLAGAISRSTLQRLQSLVITQIGCGRTGNLMASHLATMGVQHLRLIDPDRQEAHNQDAAPFMPDAAIGHSKARSLARQLRRFRPQTSVGASRRSILSEAGVSVLHSRRSDMIISCVDNDATRVRVAELAHHDLQTCHLDVATGIQLREDDVREFRADIRLSIPGHSGCVACLGASTDAGDTEDILYRIGAPDESLLRGPRQAWHDLRAGSLLPLNAMAVSAAILLLISLIQADVTRPVWHRLIWTAESGLTTDGGEVAGRQDCSVCGQNSTSGH